MTQSVRQTIKKTTNVNLPENKEKSTSATLTYGLSGAKKVELTAKIVRGLPVKEAISKLTFIPNKSSEIILAVVKSALANAKNNAGLKEEDLYVKRIDVGNGPKLKRVRFAARSRVHSVQKYRSFVRVVLDTK